MSSAWEGFHLSIYSLTGPEPQRQRLVKAYKSYLMPLCSRDVPAEIRSEFAWLAQEITRYPAGPGACRVATTVATLNDREVVLMINAIIHMYDAVTRYQPILPAPHNSRDCRVS